MIPLKNITDARTRLNRYRNQLRKRDQIVGLAQERYFMDANRKSGYYDSAATEWRDKIAPEYWETSNKSHNIVDVMTAVLGSHKPQYRCMIPGDTSSSVPSRAEMFLQGAWRLNSRRQQLNLTAEIVHRTVRDGSCGIRVYWTPDPVDIQPFTIENPDQAGETWIVQPHNQRTFPICIEAVDIAKLYPSGRGRFGKPFSEIFYVQQRTLGDVVEEWGEDGPLGEMVKNVGPQDLYVNKEEYIEWWGRDRDGVIWYAIIFRDKFIVPATSTKYPEIPFVLTGFKRGRVGESSYETLPFIYPIFDALEKHEYVRSRAFRLIDMFANMNPIHRGDTPMSGVEGTWGKLVEIGREETIEFPRWPGQPPDVYREMDMLEKSIEEGSFTSAMFGQVESGSSGYAISQLAGVDVMRADIPKANLELAFSAVADLVFGLLHAFAPNVHLAVISQIQSRRLTAMLSGNETLTLMVDAFVKPKQLNDEIRLATVGAQLASLPKPLLSAKYILEHYFGLNQPEQEINRRLDEEAMNDPIIRLMSIIEVLKEAGSPYLPIVEAQLSQMVGKAMGPGEGAGPNAGPPPESGIEQLGMGLPQAVMGNPPQIPMSGNPRQEQGPSIESLMFGGPREE